MPRRRQAKVPQQPSLAFPDELRLLPSIERWTVSEEYQLPRGKTIRRGDEVSIKHESGRFRFQRHVVTDRGVEWVDVIGGPHKISMWRSFRPSRIGTVHRIRKMIPDEEQRQAVNAKNRAKRAGL